MIIPMKRVIFRFRGLADPTRFRPSDELHEALMLLSDAKELQPLFDKADEAGKLVAIEVFHSRDGQPILIHFTKEAA